MSALGDALTIDPAFVLRIVVAAERLAGEQDRISRRGALRSALPRRKHALEKRHVGVNVLRRNFPSKRALQKRIEERAKALPVAAARGCARNELGTPAGIADRTLGDLFGQGFERRDKRRGGLLNRAVIVERSELVLVQETRRRCGVFS